MIIMAKGEKASTKDPQSLGGNYDYGKLEEWKDQEKYYSYLLQQVFLECLGGLLCVKQKLSFRKYRSIQTGRSNHQEY